jgi:hypothetical protein
MHVLVRGSCHESADDSYARPESESKTAGGNDNESDPRLRATESPPTGRGNLVQMAARVAMPDPESPPKGRGDLIIWAATEAKGQRRLSASKTAPTVAAKDDTPPRHLIQCVHGETR